jgi:2-methylisocitrate lyase-like PEP mutase family enzyme
MDNPTRLKEILDQCEYLLVVSAYDALSARVIEAVGFKVVATSGFSISASLLGKPDAGLLTVTENLATVRNVINAVNLPVIADIDTGYGNAINVMRTVEEFERAGVAAVLLEDQLEPKKCPVGHSVETISADEMVGKIRAAVSVRKNPNFLIVARTDAKGEEAIRRGKIYLGAGADMIKPGNKCFSSLEEIKQFAGQFPGKSYISVVAWMEKSLRLQDIVRAGVKVVSFPLYPVLSTTKSLFESLRYLKEHQWTPVPNDRIYPMPDFFQFIGMEDIIEKEKRFLPPGEK